MFRFFAKEKMVEKLIFDYLEAFSQTQNNFKAAIDACLLNGAFCKNFEFYLKQTHKFESKADDIRDAINDLMYSKALIPESREDIMFLVGSIDKVPAIFEEILYMVKTQGMVLPLRFISDVRNLTEISLKCCDILVEQITAFFRKKTGIRGFLKQIDELESKSDHLQRLIITAIFDSEIDPFDKLQLKDLIILVGEISDQAEEVSRQINILSLKRRV